MLARLRSRRMISLILFFALAAGAAQADGPPSTEDAQELVQQGRWAEASEAYRAIVAATPDDGASWYMLGYAHYSLEQWDDAVRAWRRSAGLDHRQADSIYGVACALSLAGRVEGAVKAFEEAVAAGFDNPYLVADDADLDNIREHPRFKKLFTPPPPWKRHPDAVPVGMTTASGSPVFGEFYRAAEATAATPIVLLIHQASSNSAEYQAIAPRLAAAGFHALALDARGGGRRFGRDNLTVAAIGPGAGFSPAAYDGAVEDALAAVAWLRARGYGGSLSVWGSSYSASLVRRLLVDASGVFVAGLAFSGGNPTDADGQPYAPRIDRPILVTWPESEFGEDQRKGFKEIGSPRKVLVEQQGGRHGSGTLDTDRNPNAEQVWARVLEFLDAHGR